MAILLFKSIHIVGFVAWFAGLFYLVRMFVYTVEARDRPQPERDILEKQFNLMQWRVYKIICNPAMMLTWTCGLVMLHLYGLEWLKSNGWMHIKLLLLALLTAYHVYCKKLIGKLEKGETPMSSFQFRLFNEVPTILLVTIVLLAVYRNGLHPVYAIGGILVFGLLMFLGARLYKKMRGRG